MDPVMTQPLYRALEGAPRRVWGLLAMETPKGGLQGPSRGLWGDVCLVM